MIDTSNAALVRAILGPIYDAGGWLMPLHARSKKPIHANWPSRPRADFETIVAHVVEGGNVGMLLGPSGFVVIDSENTESTQALVAAGFTPTTVPANAQIPGGAKAGGTHVWLRVPDGIDSRYLVTSLQLKIGGGKGLVDVLAGARYAVVPPSRLGENNYQLAGGGAFDPNSSAQLVTAPKWLFETDGSDVPAGLGSLAAVLARPDFTPVRGATAESQELTRAIDEINWEDAIGGDRRLHYQGPDACGCAYYHWHTAENERSVTLHSGGCGAVSGKFASVWSGTMISELGLPQSRTGHVALSPLTFAAVLRGCSESEAMNELMPDFRAQQYVIPAEQFAELLAQNGAVPVDSNVTAFPGERLRAVEVSANGEAPRPQGSVSPIRGVESIGSVGSPSNSTVPGAIPASFTSDMPAAAVGSNNPLPRLMEDSFEDDVEPAEIPGLEEVDFPAAPDYVKPVEGAQLKMTEVLPPLVNGWSREIVQHEWIWKATPGMSHVAAAADANGVLRWGLLGALIPRVAALIPPTARLVPSHGKVPATSEPTSAGTAVNIFSILVGGPSSGKTATMSLAESLIPNIDELPPGTGEGLLKTFPRATEDEDSGADVVTFGQSSSKIMSSDEIDVFVSEMVRQGSKTTGLMRSMWMGSGVGNVTSDKERRSHLPAHSYRFGIVLGAQPEACTPLFSEGNRGTPQRFLWMGAQVSQPRGSYPARMHLPVIQWRGAASALPSIGTVGGDLPVWIRQPPAARKELDAERAYGATSNVFSSDGGYEGSTAGDDDVAATLTRNHALLQQLKIAAVIATMDGLTQPQDTHWHVAGAIMEVRKFMMIGLIKVAESAERDMARKRGTEQGITRSHAQAAQTVETRDRVKEAQVWAFGEIQRLQQRGEKVTEARLGKCKPKRGAAWVKQYLPEAVAALTRSGYVQMTVEGHLVITLQS